MASPKKIISFCLCFILTSSVVFVEAGYGMFGLGGGRRGNEALEALLAAGIIAMLLRNQGHSFGYSMGMGHGFGIGHGHGLSYDLSMGHGHSLGHSLGHGRFATGRSSPIASSSILAPLFHRLGL